MSLDQSFPHELLHQPSSARLAYFRALTIGHPLLIQVYDDLRLAIRDSAPGSIIMVQGPAGVGKTTLLQRVEKDLKERLAPDLAQDVERLPVVRIDAIAPESGSFNWKDYFRRLLIALEEPESLAVWRFPIGALLGASVGIVLISTSYGIGRVLSVILAIFGLVLGAWLAALWTLGRHLPGNLFGLCSGMPNRANATDALTPWLHEYLNGLAGKSSDEPLTFGELWAGVLRGPGAPAPYDGKSSKAIDLAMITTAVNLARPFRIPFESRDLFFVEEELQPLFPKAVADWIVNKARPSATATSFSTSD